MKIGRVGVSGEGCVRRDDFCVGDTAAGGNGDAYISC